MSKPKHPRKRYSLTTEIFCLLAILAFIIALPQIFVGIIIAGSIIMSIFSKPSRINDEPGSF